MDQVVKVPKWEALSEKSSTDPKTLIFPFFNLRIFVHT
jgi:hypothetical protein